MKIVFLLMFFGLQIYEAIAVILLPAMFFCFYIFTLFRRSFFKKNCLTFDQVFSFTFSRFSHLTSDLLHSLFQLNEF